METAERSMQVIQAAAGVGWRGQYRYTATTATSCDEVPSPRVKAAASPALGQWTLQKDESAEDAIIGFSARTGIIMQLQGNVTVSTDGKIITVFRDETRAKRVSVPLVQPLSGELWRGNY